ncbi:MAG: SDR family oxidoreductase [Chthoniobacterales bacterium]|nr:SDR family oxidoreductase [Chthoniobacterales bacterium]
MKRFLVTGASRGIGRAIAEALAGEGITLLLHGRDEAALAATRQLVEAKGGRATTLAFDLRDRGQINEMVAQANAEPLDALVNNAGIAVVKPYDALTVDEWLETLAINVTAPFLLTQQLAPQMPRGSSIVNILSPAAKTGFPGWSSYCMSKFALEGFSQSLREELRSSGVRVINIYPSATDTDIWSGVEGEWPREKMIAAHDVAAAVAYALAQPATVVVENVSVASLAGTL